MLFRSWIRLNKSVELLDTPGILWPKFDDQEIGIRLAFIGSIKEEVLNITELAIKLIHYLQKNYQGVLKERYQADEEQEVGKVLEDIAKNRACLLKGGEYDIEKAAALLMDDFRNGRLGRITLEVPENIE